MITYHVGQIEKDHRGTWSALVTQHRDSRELGVHILPILSHDGSEMDKDFIYVTGVGMISNPIKRAYLGLKKEAAESIALRLNDLNNDASRLKELDDLVIIPFFKTKEL